VLGFWDGESFIPIDFSLHREKGNQKAADKLRSAVKMFFKKVDKQDIKLKKHKINYTKNLAFRITTDEI